MQSLTKIFVLISVIIAIGSSFKLQSIDDIYYDSELKSTQQCNTSYFEYQSLKRISDSKYLQGLFNTANQTTDGNELETKDQTVYQILSLTRNFFMSVNQNLTSYFGQNNDIIFEGGKIRFHTVFNWSKHNTPNPKIGWGIAVGITKQIPYSIRNSQTTSGFILNQVGKFIVDDLYIVEMNCDSANQFNCNMDPEEMSNFTLLLTKDSENVTSIKTSLERKVNDWLNSRLAERVCCQTSEAIEKFEYVWKNTLGQAKFVITKTNRSSLIIKNGLSPGYYESADIQIEDFSDYRCGALPTNSSLDPKVYGGNQQFISKTFIENFLVSAARKGALSMILNEQNCQTPSFNFTVAALVPILENIDKVFDKDASVNGTCEPDEKTIEVSKDIMEGGFGVKLDQKCQLMVNGKNIQSFRIDINMVIAPDFNNDLKIYFRAKKWVVQNSYEPSAFRMISISAADKIITEGFSDVVKGRLIGSGWPTFLKTLIPQITITENAIVAYDLLQV